MKDAGFRKRGHSFNRTREPGLVQVVSYQMGRYDPPGLVEIPGLRESVYGLFSLHLGVHVEEAWRLQMGASGPDGPPAAKQWVNDYDCQLRRVVDNAAGASMQFMWSLEDPEAGSTMVDLLHGDVFPWLDRFSSRTAILEALENAPVESREIAGIGPDRLLATHMRLADGDRRRAQQHFDEWVTHCRRRVASERHIRGHLEYLAGFADRVGLTMPSTDPAG